MTRSSTAAEQFKRLLTLLPRLADGEDHPVADVATIIGVSPEELIDDLNALVDRFDTPGGFVDAVQIFHEGDVVSVITPHFRRPMRLTMAELCALELGLAILRTECPVDRVKPVDRAIERLREVISHIPAAEQREDLIVADPGGHGVDRAHLVALRDAVRHRRKARLLYRKAAEPEAELRQVCPYCVVFASGMWYVVAHCERASDLRVFRLDRVESVEGAGEGFEVPSNFSVDQVLEKSRGLMTASSPERMRVRYSPRIAKWIAEREGVTLESDGSAFVSHPLHDDQWAIRHVLQYGPDAEVLSPVRVREEVRSALESITAAGVTMDVRGG